jgi:hypothetical protein
MRNQKSDNDTKMIIFGKMYLEILLTLTEHFSLEFDHFISKAFRSFNLDVSKLSIFKRYNLSDFWRNPHIDCGGHKK